MLSGGYDVVSVHDPELIPAALIARLLRRRVAVVDVHEHVPGQVLHKDWVWRPLRRPVAWLAHRALLPGHVERAQQRTLRKHGART